MARSRTTEASALGAGMCAAVGAGWFAAPSAAAQAMCGEIVRTTEPCPQDAARYAELVGIYRELYPQLKASYAKLAQFITGG